MDLKYRRAAPGDVDPLHAIVVACGQHLSRTVGLSHWDPPYALERMRKDAAEREVYAVSDAATGGRVIGTFTVGDSPIASYPASLWSVPSASALYLNRLAIVPELHGHGLGRTCMIEIERLAAARGSGFVRFDAVTAHGALCDFYRRLGYVDRGPFDLTGIAVTCFEKCVPRAASDTR